MSPLVFICLLLLLSMWIIFAKSNKDNALDQSSYENYYFANRNLPAILLSTTIIATQVGGGGIIAVANEAYASGWWGIVYPLGQIIGLIVIATFFVDRFQHMKLSTVSEIFTRHYQSPLLRQFASIISTISLFFILVAQGIAAKKLLLSIGITDLWWLSAIWMIVVFYTSFGGFSMVVKTDLVQVGIIVAALLVLLYFLLEIPQGHHILNAHSWEPVHGLNAVNTIVWATCFMLIEQDMIQRYVSAKSSSILKKALWGAVIGLTSIAVLPTLIGIYAKKVGVPATESGSILIQTALTHCPQWAYLLVCIGILMAILSTVDSLMSAISSLVVLDRKQTIEKPAAITLTIGVLALIGCLYANDIIHTLVFAYGLTASALFVPVACAIARIPFSLNAVYTATLAGIISYIALHLTYSEWNFMALVVSAICGYIANLQMKSQKNP